MSAHFPVGESNTIPPKLEYYLYQCIDVHTRHYIYSGVINPYHVDWGVVWCDWLQINTCDDVDLYYH